MVILLCLVMYAVMLVAFMYDKGGNIGNDNDSDFGDR